MVLAIALCDDEKQELKKAAAMLERWFAASRITGSIKCFENGSELLSAIENGEQFHIYILDVLMPGLNGIEIGERLQEKQADGAIIYLSSSKDYAADSYDVNAFYYLVKPVLEHKLFEILDKAAARLANTEDRSIIVPTGSGEQHIAYRDILYVERVSRHAVYSCAFGTVKSNTLRGSFREAVNPLLNDRRFYLYGASFVINLSKVTTINNQEILLAGNIRLTLPKAYTSDFKKAWGAYWLGVDR